MATLLMRHSPHLFPSNHDIPVVFRKGLDFPLWGERVAPSGSNLVLGCQIEGENLFKCCLDALLETLLFLNRSLFECYIVSIITRHLTFSVTECVKEVAIYQLKMLMVMLFLNFWKMDFLII